MSSTLPVTKTETQPQVELADFHDESDVSPLPALLLGAVSPREVGHASEWLRSQGGVASVGLVLRMHKDYADWLNQLSVDDPRYDKGMVDSARGCIERLVRGAVEYAAPRGSPWRNSIVELPYIHSCLVRLPIAYLGKFLGSQLFEGPCAGVAGLLFGDEIRTPEYRAEDKRGYDPVQQRAQVHETLQALADCPEGAINRLGIADFSSDFWRHNTGVGQTAVVVDSGQDESHPALQEQIVSHVFFDQFAAHKEAKYSIDRGCHGTKIAGLIAGKTVDSNDIGVPIARRVCLGIAPAAKVVSMNVLHGECLKERGSLLHLLAALEWSVQNRRNPKYGRYQVINISAEALSSFAGEMSPTIDMVLDMVHRARLVTLFAAGNQGDRVVRVGSKGTYVAACDDNGRRLEQSGRNNDLLAPGNRLLCCQPPVPMLGSDLVGIHSGTSLATAVVSAGLLRLCQATGKPAHTCLRALRKTSGANKPISLDAAYRFLMGRNP